MVVRFAEAMQYGLCAECGKWSRLAAWVWVVAQPRLLCSSCRLDEDVSALTEQEIEEATR
jgi:hypothetical protein